MPKLTGTKIEAAARKLCELRSIVPDAMLEYNAEPDVGECAPMVPVQNRVPEWLIAKGKIERHLQIAEAVKYGIAAGIETDIRAYLSMLPEHARTRQGALLLESAAARIEALRRTIQNALKDDLTSYVDGQ